MKSKNRFAVLSSTKRLALSLSYVMAIRSESNWDDMKGVMVFFAVCWQSGYRNMSGV